ncbi:unnamed protein product, partial [Amoebophrya sp. A25]
ENQSNRVLHSIDLYTGDRGADPEDVIEEHDEDDRQVLRHGEDLRDGDAADRDEEDLLGQADKDVNVNFQAHHVILDLRDSTEEANFRHVFPDLFSKTRNGNRQQRQRRIVRGSRAKIDDIIHFGCGAHLHLLGEIKVADIPFPQVLSTRLSLRISVRSAL